MDRLLMVDFFDMLQCPVCKDYYVPKTTVTGRLVPHCIDGEYSSIEKHVVKYVLTDVVGERLTGRYLDIEV